MELNQKFFNPSIEWQLWHCAAYESFPNNECHIPFQFYISNYQPLKWQDITVLEEYWLLRKIQLPLLFPNIPMAEEIWNDFSRLNSFTQSDSHTTDMISTFSVRCSRMAKEFLIHAYTTQNMLATPYVEDPWNNCTIHTAGTGKNVIMVLFYVKQSLKLHGQLKYIHFSREYHLHYSAMLLLRQPPRDVLMI